MPIYCNTYDIHLYQGQSFFLDLNYSNDDGDFVDLNGATYEARMQVRRSPLVSDKLLALSSENYPILPVGTFMTLMLKIKTPIL
jgi:hypothetical protein